MSKFEFEGVRSSSSSMDDFFSPPKPLKRIASVGKVRIANLQELVGFYQIGADKLVRLSQQDFWQLGHDEEGHFIERLVDDVDGPVKY
jgi:hypothetical protein